MSRQLTRSAAIVGILWFGLSACLGACGPSSSGGGDAAVDAAPDDADLADVPVLPDTSVPDAYVPGCGNGTLDQDEVCDDGNTFSGDGCNSTCTREDDDDFVGNSFTANNQIKPRVVASGENVVAIWTDEGGVDGSGFGVRVRMFGDDGIPIDAAAIGSDLDFPANTTFDLNQLEGRIAAAPDGRFAVVWADESNALGGGTDVRAALFDADGARRPTMLGQGPNDFVVNTTATGTQTWPSVAINDNGAILITWSDDSATGGDASGWAIKGRLIDFDGNALINPEAGHADDFLVNVTTPGSQYRPVSAAGGNAYFLVIYLDDTNFDGSGTGLVGTMLNADGSHQAADFLVNSTTANTQEHPAVAIQPGAGFVVAWTDDSRGADDSFFRGIRARAFDNAGAPRANGITLDTNDFQVNTLVQGSQQWPSIAVDGVSGGIFVTWHDGSASDGSWAGIRGRIFSPGLSPVGHPEYSPAGDDFTLNFTTQEAQLNPAAVYVTNAVFVFWEDYSLTPPDSDGAAIRYRALPPLWP